MKLSDARSARRRATHATHAAPAAPTALAALAAVAALGAVGPAGAQVPAEGGVQFYGSVTAAVVRKEHQTGGGSLSELGNSLLSASYFGIRGSEPLGGGLSAVFRLEAPFGTDTGNVGTTVGTATKFFARQSYVGLETGQLGSLTIGRQFHAATDRVIRTLDVYNVAGTSLHTTPLALFGVNRYAGNDGRADDSIKLRVNGPAGLQAGASHGMDDGAGRSYTIDVAQVTPAYAVAAWAAQFNSPNIVAATGNRPRQSLWGVGGNVPIGPVRLYLHVIDSVLEPTVANRLDQKNRLVHLGANWQAAPGVVVKASLYDDRGKALNGIAARDGTKTTWVASAEYFLSRRTSLHAAYFSNRFEGGYRLETLNINGLGRDPNAASTSGVTAGIRHDF